MSIINSNGTMAFGNALGGSVTILPKNDTATNYTIDIPDVSGTLATQEWANSQDLGVGQTWQNMTASRVAGTTYTNSTGKPIVAIGSWVTSVPADAYAVVNGVIVGQINSSNHTGTVTVVIPNNGTYTFFTAGGTMSKWSELR